MYSEQLMREQGFDDAPNFRLNMYTDAIWRACRIILDVRMHRGEIERRGGDGRSSSRRRASRRRTPGPRSTATRTRPTYQLSYLLGKVLLLQLRADEQRAPRADVRPPRLPRHAAPTTGRCRSASTAGSCARRRPTGGRGLARRAALSGRARLIAEVQVIPAIDLDRRPLAGRVLARRVVRRRRPDGSAGPDRRAVRRARGAG